MQSSCMHKPYIGIDIGGTLAKVCYAVEKNQANKFQHIAKLTSIYILSN